MKRRLKRIIENMSPLDTLSVCEGINDKKEKRIYTLLLKGVIVYLISAGLIGGALSATKTSFSEPVFNAVILALSMIISLVYYNKKSENIGDIAYLIGLVIFGVFYGSYINSGFYTWMNEIIGTASVYFDIPEIGGYATRVSNLSMAVTFAGCYLGAVAVIIVNMSIVKKMHFLDLVLDAVIILFLPAYLELEPGFYYVSILVIGLILSAVWAMGGRFVKYDNNNAYAIEKDNITYAYDVRAHICVFIRVILITLIVLLGFYAVFPKEDYGLIRKTSESKGKTDDVVEKFITTGIYGFLNKYDNVGGMSSGRLGGVNSVRLDYETDLIVTYEPYSFEPVYLRTFVGGEYKPYDNLWKVAPDSYVNENECERLKEAYLKRESYSGRGVIGIQNIDADIACYQPYYSNKTEKLQRGEAKNILFYPLFFEGQHEQDTEGLSLDERNFWLTVPNDNKPSVIKFVEELGIDKDMNEFQIALALKRYYEDNYPYTLRPGSTPYRKDFVNYFLDKKKKGYCVHFASAATLAFRQMGIPARYVEGYVLDSNDILNGKVNDSPELFEYYDGYSEYDKSAVVDVELSDASAHAWVEIYSERYGWVPVELTPPSYDVEVTEDSFWTRFMNMLVPGNSSDEESADGGQKLQFDGKKIRIGIYVLFAILLFLALMGVIRYFILDFAIYLRADINTRLVLKYKKFIKRNSKKFPELLSNPNYRDQINYLLRNVMPTGEKDKMVSILERAGFSNTIITEEEFKYVSDILKKYRRGALK